MFKKLGIAALLSLLLPLSSQAATFDFDGGTDFTFSQDGTTTAGQGTGTGTLNTAASPAGFGGFFSQAVLGGSNNTYSRLGASDAGPANNNAAASGSSSATSIQFVNFTGIDTLTVQFSYAFVGNATSGVDRVGIFLFDPLGVNELVSVGTLTFTGSTSNLSQAFTLNGDALSTFVSGADYSLVFQLSEGIGAGNSAFGIDAITVTGVPEPSPLFGLLALSGLIGGAAGVRRWQCSSFVSAD